MVVVCVLHKRFPLSFALLLGLLAVALAPFVVAETLQGVRVHEAPEYTRVVFDTSEPMHFKLFTLSGPNRVVIDLPNAQLGNYFDAKNAAKGRKLISDLRVGRRGDGYRVVIDTQGRLKPNGFRLDPVAPHGYRLVVDLYGEVTKATGQTAKTERMNDGARNDTGRRDILVAVDAGHGGEDPGAVGVDKIYEKQVVFKLSQRLVARLNKTPGFKAVMVREGDYYLSLRKRIEVARSRRADLFLSIHADAFDNASVHGASVYTLSDNGASSETARWLAAQENRSDLIGGVSDVRLKDKDSVLAHVLLDLSMDANRSTSINAGTSILKQLGTVAKLHKSRVEQAGFVVLKSPDIPSILVETGYMSNPRESRQLNTTDYQEKITAAVHKGITEYMTQSPPAGTLLAARLKGLTINDQSVAQLVKQSVRHKIRPGETLSGIAQRYDTSMAQIKQANRMRDNSIRSGQTLIIPSS